MSAIAGQMVGAIGGQMMDIMAENRADHRQRRAEDRSEQRERNMAHMYDQYARDKFEYTGYGAQAQQLKNAGMNIGLMYGNAGQGGQASASSASSAPTTPSVQNNTAQYMAMGAQTAMMEAQKENIEANTEKTKAEADNITGGVRENLTEDSRGKKFNNDINETFRDKIIEAKNWDWDKGIIDGEEKNAVWEMKKAIDYNGLEYGNGKNAENTRAGRARIAELAIYEQDLIQAKTENNIKKAEEVIKDFEASMARQGISPNSPWYAKLITDLLNKVGLLDIIGIGQKAVKNEVKQITK